MAQSKNITDMTVGSPLRHILTFTVPLLIGNLFQQFYNIVDSMVVGNFVGANALAAVGTCGSLGFLFFSLALGLSIGVGILASQFFGAKNPERIRATIANAIYILIAAALLFSTIGFIAAPALLRMLHTPDTILPDAVTYLRITSLGILGIALYNGVASLLRALGDSKSPLYFLICACIVNIALDLLFVIQFRLGVLGVALATIISQYFSFFVSAVYAWKKVSYFQLTRAEMKPDWDIILRSLKLGIPVAVQMSMIAVSMIALQTVVNGFGETVMAAFTVVGRVEELVQQPFSSLGTAVTSFSGQNMGAGKIDRVKQGFKLSTIVVFILAMAVIPAAYFGGEFVIHAFVKEPAVVAIGVKALVIDSLFFFPLGMIHIPRAVLNGCGDAGFAMINGFVEVVCRILFAQILTRIPVIGFWGIWITTGLTWSVTSLICVYRYSKGKWKTMRMA